jgi:hypothetical protein
MRLLFKPNALLAAMRFFLSFQLHAKFSGLVISKNLN